jgi:hypothetical protein
MELLGNPKTAYLLEASLQTLHAESLEWLHEIDFWQEEMSFFFKILRRKELIHTLPPLDMEAIDREMIRITSMDLDAMKYAVQEHERMLKDVLNVVLAGEETRYRNEHRSLLQKMHSLEQVIRQFKKRVFDFIKRFD